MKIATLRFPAPESCEECIIGQKSYIESAYGVRRNIWCAKLNRDVRSELVTADMVRRPRFTECPLEITEDDDYGS